MLDQIKRFSGYIREFLAYIRLMVNPKRDPLIKFVITTSGRAGSNLLVELLNSHPEICCESELLVKRVYSPVRFLYACEKLSSRDVFGFKLNTYNFGVQHIVDPVDFVQELYKQEYKFISLRRRNIVKQAISLIVATQRGKFHLKREFPEKMQEFSVYISSEKMLDTINFFRYQRALEERILDGIPHYILYYEDHLSNGAQHQTTVNKICDHLGISYADVCSDLVKTTPEDLSAIIENYPELIRFLKMSEYSDYIDF